MNVVSFDSCKQNCDEIESMLSVQGGPGLRRSLSEKAVRLPLDNPEPASKIQQARQDAVLSHRFWRTFAQAWTR
jgi:hypothetical protein